VEAYRGSRGIAPLFLTSALAAGEWSAWSPHRKESRYGLNRRLGGPHSPSELLEERKI